jgi:glycosyltransferase involved in cell wall biosynthesis
LLQAIAALISDGVIDSQKIAVRFVGPCEITNGRYTATIIEEFGLTGIAEVVHLVPRPQALRELLSAHVLLLLAGDHRLSVAAKVYEYLAAGRPILAISGEGSVADIIHRTAAGRVVAPDDLQGARNAVAYWYGLHLNGVVTAEEPELSSAALEYSWTRLGARYAELIWGLSQFGQ